MMNSSLSCVCRMCLFLFIFVSSLRQNVRARKLVEGKALAPAIFIFGDSTVDPGNNNFISTPFKSNFPPYGRDFANQVPTGRFTNGQLANDYIAKYVGIKDYVPPYLDPRLTIEDLMTGVSFASAGSGFDPLTPKISNVIPLWKQIEYFKEYKLEIEGRIGKEKTKELIENALFLVSAGTNDFVVNYFTLPIRRQNYTMKTYMDFVLQNARQFTQELWEQGGRRMGVVGLPPMGCLPVVITMYSPSSSIMKRDCLSNYSSIARDYNQMLQTELQAMQARLSGSGSRIAYFDVYGPLEDMTLGHKYDFEVVNSGCCGTGWLEFSFMCNPRSSVCPDASKYVFWDAIHPTQRAYFLLFQALQPAIDSLIRQ